MKKIIFCALIFFAAHCGFTQSSFFDNYVCQIWNTFGGLTGTTATDICQTGDGYINIGTYEGLVRFDGIVFNVLRRGRDNPYKFISVRTIYEDSDGTIWLGTNDEGLHKLTLDEQVVYNMQNGLPNNSIRAITRDKSGNLWIGTAAGVVYLTPDGKIITPQFEPGSVAKGIITTHLYCDTSGRVWLITANECGLFVYQDGLFRTIPDFDEYGNYTASFIFQDRSGTFWVGLGSQGLFRMSINGVTRITTGTLLDYTGTNVIHQDLRGTIWFGSEKGLVVYDNGEYSVYSGNTLEGAAINEIISDREGNIWIATDRSGLGKLSLSKFKMMKLGVTVNSLAESPDGKIWAGTDKGVCCYEHDREVKNSLVEYTKGMRVRDVTIAKNGDILVSVYTSPGQIRWSEKGMKTWSRDEGLAGNKVRLAMETVPDELYVGTTTGLSIIHSDGSIKSFDIYSGLLNEYVMALHKDDKDVVWIGTDGGGIYLMKDEKIIKHITSDDGLAGNVIFKITQDEEDGFWICTGGGLSYCPPFDSSQGRLPVIQSINSDHGLSTDSVFQIIRDNTNNVWMTSNHGLSSASFADIKQAITGKSDYVKVKNYGKNDGLDSKGATSTAKSLVDRYGRIWITMVDGIAIYDPMKVSETPVMPLVHIEKISVDNVEYKDFSTQIDLKPGTKRVEITFTGLSFDAPERIQFTHRLTNFEDDFSEPSALRTISYTNLRPGKHVFYVNAINGDGFYSEQAEVAMFLQKPYFYQVPAFWITVAILLMGTIIVVFYLKQRAIRLENIRLEKKVQERTQELKVEKDKSDMLLHAILPAKIAEELKGEIRSIGESFDDVTLLFSDIVSFTKTSSAHTASEIVDALNDLFCRFDRRAISMGIEKIKTIGDAYMAACGLPERNPDHARKMVEFAKGMYEDLAEYNRIAKIHFELRIGLNSGPVTAGVIGTTKFIYDVWGNTVNVASRMETACTPGKIRVSQTVYEHLAGTDIKFSDPINSDVKGKGIMTTYDIL